MSSRPDPFWLCHECGAQMRPLRIDGVPHCASCNGEFIEILDSSVNPDPFHELPPAPPVRPSSADPYEAWPQQRPTSPRAGNGGTEPSGAGGAGGGGGGFMQSLFSNIFGSGDEAQNTGVPQPPRPPSQRPTSPTQPGQQGGGRSFTFQIGNSGQGRVYFGSGPQMNPFDPFGMSGMGRVGYGQQGSGSDQGLEGFFPGFSGMGGTPFGGPQGQRRPPGMQQGMTGGPEDLMRGLMEMLHHDGVISMNQGGAGGPNMIFIGPQGRSSMGDYATSEAGFNAILEQLMHAAGPQGPLPATEAVIDGLPRMTFTEETLEKSAYKDCPVCKDDFRVGDEVMKIPCGHVCHPDCLQPWLKINGSCPVCRFSLVPDEGNRPPQQPGPSTQAGSRPAPAAPASQTAQQQPGATEEPGQSTITSILNRLWGQAGSTSGQTSPTTEVRSPPLAASQSPPATHSTGEQAQSAGHAADTVMSDAAASVGASGNAVPPTAGPNLSSAIPDDYRERHRRREQQEHHDPPMDDLD